MQTAPKHKEIEEKGGLKNLRSQVEDAGGKMEIISMPEFEMRITFPGISS